MTDINELASSGFVWMFDGPASHLWPLLVVPSLAAWVSDRAARSLPPTRADWRIAALLAASPGFAMLTIMAMIFVRTLRHTEPGKGWDHFAQYQGSALAAAAILGFALSRAARRHRQLLRLTGLATPPSPRLAGAAVRASIAVRQLPGRSCEIFVAGILRPIVYVSSGALERMGEEELAAALQHERAHVVGNDPVLFALLAFLRDVSPSSERAAGAFLQARERLADAQAVRSAGSLALASALIAAVKPAPRSLPAPGIGGTGSVEWRLEAILGVEPAGRKAARPSLGVWGSLALNLLLAAWPAGHIAIAYQLCC